MKKLCITIFACLLMTASVFAERLTVTADLKSFVKGVEITFLDLKDCPDISLYWDLLTTDEWYAALCSRSTAEIEEDHNVVFSSFEDKDQHTYPHYVMHYARRYLICEKLYGYDLSKSIQKKLNNYVEKYPDAACYTKALIYAWDKQLGTFWLQIEEIDLGGGITTFVVQANRHKDKFRSYLD